MALVYSARPRAAAPPGLLAGRAALRLRWLALGAASWATAVFVLDQVARVALPSGALAAALLLADVFGLLLAAATTVAAWLGRRDDAGLLLTASLAPIVLAVRLLAVQVLGLLDLATFGDVADGGLGLLGLGLLSWTALAVVVDGGPRVRRDAADALFARVVEVTTLVVFAAGLSGTGVRATGASWACDGTLLCRLGIDTLSDIQGYHRLLAYLAVGLGTWLAIEAFRTQRDAPLVGPAAVALLAALWAQGLVGWATVQLGVPPVAQAVHAVGNVVTWLSVLVLAFVTHRAVAVAPERVAAAAAVAVAVPTEVVPRRRLRLLAAYVQLTKPRVMSLLLATTAAAMVIAARGMPPLGLLLATLLGGALMSGGAGAINHYVDRDIDPLMGRTAWRPIPSGVIAPARALWFGILLAALATVVLLVWSGPLATLFALLGLLGYVFIYTLWLKRSTPSNIVIGGAAGAIPPLVGWAAVTHEVSSLTAWYLFAIIFFWTPPHFWALSLLIRQHYERAGVPMLPVVRGEAETRKQIVLYSVLLVALTLVLSPFGMMGLVYFASALVLGSLFIVDAVRLWREASRPAARRLYLYSILYLFVLFVAMAVDRSL